MELALTSADFNERFARSPQVIEEDDGSHPIIGISPTQLNFGVVSAGFYYNMKFAVQNNSLSPIRVRITCTPNLQEQNAIRLVYLPDRIAPGISVMIILELTAEFVGMSAFTLQVVQSADSRVYTRLVEANVISPDTFKYVKKSLQLQERPIYRKNVSSVGAITGLETTSVGTPATSFSETMIMDDEDIQDLLDLPMVANTYWDPFDKVLRIDPEVGRVAVDKSITLDESITRTAERRSARLEELEEQGLYTMDSMKRLREGQHQRSSHPLTTRSSTAIDVFDTLDDDSQTKEEEEDGLMSRNSSMSRVASVSSVLALKREKIERLRRATIDSSKDFSTRSRSDSMVNSMRTLTMIQGRLPTPSGSAVKLSAVE